MNVLKVKKIQVLWNVDRSDGFVESEVYAHQIYKERDIVWGGFVHFPVNRSTTFKDLQSGTHANSIDGEEYEEWDKTQIQKERLPSVSWQCCDSYFCKFM